MKSLCFLLFVIWMPGSLAVADVVYGVKSFGTGQISSAPPASLFRFQPGDAMVTEVGVITRGGQIDVDGLALSSDGLFGFERSGANSRLISINPATATATLIGSDLSGRQIRGATFDQANRLWAIDQITNQLLQIDHTTGSVVGAGVNLSTSISEIVDIAVNANGEFMLVDDQSFYSLDPLTGQMNLLFVDNDTSVDGYQLANLGLAFDPTAASAVYTLDIQENDDIFRYGTSSGFNRSLEYGNVYLGFNSGRGDLASSPFAIPEPAAIPLLGLLSGVCLLVRRRRKTPKPDADLASKRRQFVAPIILVITVGLISLPSPETGAQVVDWTNTNSFDSFWQNGNNWSPAGQPVPTETARFRLGGSYEVWWNSATGAPTVGQLLVTGGDVTFLNLDSAPRRRLTIIGSNSVSDLSVTGASTHLSVQGLNLSSLGGAEIGAGAMLTLDGTHSAGTSFAATGTAGLDVSGILNVQGGSQVFTSKGVIGRAPGFHAIANISGAGSEWIITSGVTLGGDNGASGTMNIEDGGRVESGSARIGLSSNSTGSVTLSGANSKWVISDSLSIGVQGSVGTLSIEGGQVSNSSATIGTQFLSTASTATVTGGNSHWNNSENLTIGNYGIGTLDVEAGGSVTSKNGRIGTSNLLSSGNGTVSVTGNESHWDISQDLKVGVSNGAIGRVNVDSNGLVTVGGRTSINANSSVVLNGGRLEFGTIDFADYGRIGGGSGELVGHVDISGYNPVSSLPDLAIANLVTSEIGYGNSGVIYGSGVSSRAMTNNSDGEIRTVAGEWARFGDIGNINAGEINNFGGVVEFENDLANQAGGFITGRGQFIANGGWMNQGVMAFSGGPTDVLGDVENVAGGQLVTSGGATTTFYDDVVHNGTEIRTAANSKTIFFGQVMGAGDFTGAGTVFFEGDLRPGNSPDIVNFEGDVAMGSFSSLQLELGGETPGEFDQLTVDGDFFLDGNLGVELINGFELLANQEFLVADVGGTLDGQFNGLIEGDLVGSFGGRDLFVSYRAGDGNDLALFTSAVPEPGGLVVCSLALVAVVSRRKRRGSQ